MKAAIVLLILIIFLPLTLLSQQAEKPTIEEWLIRLENDQLKLEQRIEALHINFNSRLDEIKADMDHFFDGIDQQNSNKNFGSIDKWNKAIDQRMVGIKFWLHAIFAALVVLFSTVSAQCVIMLKKKDKISSTSPELQFHRNTI